MAKKRKNQAIKEELQAYTIELDVSGQHGVGVRAAGELQARLRAGGATAIVQYRKHGELLDVQAALPVHQVVTLLEEKGYKAHILQEQTLVELAQKSQVKTAGKTKAELEQIIAEQERQIHGLTQATAEKEAGFARRETRYGNDITTLTSQVQELQAQLKKKKQKGGITIPVTDDYSDAIINLFTEHQALQHITELNTHYTTLRRVLEQEHTPFEASAVGRKYVNEHKRIIDFITQRSPTHLRTEQLEQARKNFEKEKELYDSVHQGISAENIDQARQPLAEETIHLLYTENDGVGELVLPVFEDEDIRTTLAQDILSYVQTKLDSAQTAVKKQKKDLSYEQGVAGDLVSFTITPQGGVPVSYLLAQVLNNGNDVDHPLKQAGLGFSVGGLGVIRQQRSSTLERTVQEETGEQPASEEEPVSTSFKHYDVSLIPRIAPHKTQVYQTIIDIVSEHEGEELRTDDLSKLVKERLGDDSLYLGKEYFGLKKMGALESRAGRRSGYTIGDRLRTAQEALEAQERRTERLNAYQDCELASIKGINLNHLDKYRAILLEVSVRDGPTARQEIIEGAQRRLQTRKNIPVARFNELEQLGLLDRVKDGRRVNYDLGNTILEYARP